MWLVEVLTALCLFTSAQTQPAARPQAPPSGQTDGADIIVQGRDADALDRFVDRVTRARNGEQFARWNDPICPRVLGAEGGHDTAMITRIAETAKRVGVKTRTGKCTPNVIVIVAADADTVVDFLTKRYPSLFQDRRSTAHELDQMEAVLRVPRPVRWISASRIRNADGMPVGSQSSISASLLAPPTREDALLSLTIVDAQRMAGVSWGQLADYVTMVALAKPDPGARYDSGSILALFDDRDAGRPLPDGLTATDTGFLRALYRSSIRDTASQSRTTIKHAITGR